MPHVAAPCAYLEADGSAKLRPVDDLSRSQVNSACSVSEKLSSDSLDTLIAAMRCAHGHFGSDLHLWKADIASAFRRIPVKPQHRKFAWVTWKVGEKVYAAQHLVMPFGAKASVHHWYSEGDFLLCLARRLLHLPVMRQVT